MEGVLELIHRATLVSLSSLDAAAVHGGVE
jgi:hypothetical protein